MDLMVLETETGARLIVHRSVARSCGVESNEHPISPDIFDQLRTEERKWQEEQKKAKPECMALMVI